VAAAHAKSEKAAATLNQNAAKQVGQILRINAGT